MGFKEGKPLFGVAAFRLLQGKGPGDPAVEREEPNGTSQVNVVNEELCGH